MMCNIEHFVFINAGSPSVPGSDPRLRLSRVGNTKPLCSRVLCAAKKSSASMKDFWLSCGHHLTDRDAGGGLLVTEELLKGYLARPELVPPPEACPPERALHAVLL